MSFVPKATYHVYFYDKGNCDIFDIEVGALNELHAMFLGCMAYAKADHDCDEIWRTMIERVD